MKKNSIQKRFLSQKIFAKNEKKIGTKMSFFGALKIRFFCWNFAPKIGQKMEQNLTLNRNYETWGIDSRAKWNFFLTIHFDLVFILKFKHVTNLTGIEQSSFWVLIIRVGDYRLWKIIMKRIMRSKKTEKLVSHPRWQTFDN